MIRIQSADELMPLLASYQQTNAYINADFPFFVIFFRVLYCIALYSRWKKHVSLSLSNNTLWNILEEPKIMNASEFEDLFAKTTTQTKRKPLSETYEKKAKARKVTAKWTITWCKSYFCFWDYLQCVACPLEGVDTIQFLDARLF